MRARRSATSVGGAGVFGGGASFRSASRRRIGSSEAASVASWSRGIDRAGRVEGRGSEIGWGTTRSTAGGGGVGVGVLLRSSSFGDFSPRFLQWGSFYDTFPFF